MQATDVYNLSTVRNLAVQNPNLTSIERYETYLFSHQRNSLDFIFSTMIHRERRTEAYELFPIVQCTHAIDCTHGTEQKARTTP